MDALQALLSRSGHRCAGARTADQRVQAREQLTRATAMCREMDMRFWLDQAEAETRQSA